MMLQDYLQALASHGLHGHARHGLRDLLRHGLHGLLRHGLHGLLRHGLHHHGHLLGIQGCVLHHLHVVPQHPLHAQQACGLLLQKDCLVNHTTCLQALSRSLEKFHLLAWCEPQRLLGHRYPALRLLTQPMVQGLVRGIGISPRHPI